MEDRAMDRIMWTYGWTQRTPITNCGDCPLFVRSRDSLEPKFSGECLLSGKVVDDWHHTPEWCQLELEM